MATVCAILFYQLCKKVFFVVIRGEKESRFFLTYNQQITLLVKQLSIKFPIVFVARYQIKYLLTSFLPLLLVSDWNKSLKNLNYVSQVRKKNQINNFKWTNFFQWVVYQMRAIKTRSWFETALEYKPWILDTNIEKFACLVHE